MKSPFLKNVLSYSLNRDIPFDPDELQAQLKHFEFTPCAAQDFSKSGWVNVTPEALVLVEDGQILLCYQTESKIIPPATINDDVAARVEKIEREQSRKVRRSERLSLKDEALQSLLPRAFSRRSQAYLWIDSVHNRIFVEAASAKSAEDMLALLRKTVGSLPVVPMMASDPIELTLTEWIRTGDLPAGYAIGDEAELVAILEEGGKLGCKKQDLLSDEVRSHIEAGKLVTKLALDWQERMQFRLADDFSLKAIKYSDGLVEQNDDIDREDVHSRMRADFLLFTSEFISCYGSLLEALGGVAKR